MIHTSCQVSETGRCSRSFTIFIVSVFAGTKLFLLKIVHMVFVSSQQLGFFFQNATTKLFWFTAYLRINLLDSLVQDKLSDEESFLILCHVWHPYVANRWSYLLENSSQIFLFVAFCIVSSVTTSRYLVFITTTSLLSVSINSFFDAICNDKTGKYSNNKRHMDNTAYLTNSKLIFVTLKIIAYWIHVFRKIDENI